MAQTPAFSVTLNPAWTGLSPDQIIITLNDFSEVRHIYAVSAAGGITSDLQFSKLEKGQLSCDISKLPSGVWFLKIQGDQPSVTLKLAIAK